VKCISTQSITRSGFKALAHDVQTLARAEGLEAHARAVAVRQTNVGARLSASLSDEVPK
jgi:histidinol dehydrogenase